MVVLAPLYLFALVLIKWAIGLGARCARKRGKTRDEEGTETNTVENPAHDPVRGRANTRTEAVEQGGIGVALGVNNLRGQRSSVAGKARISTCTLYRRAFIDNHEVVMAFFAHEKSVWDTRIHRGAILLTGLYGNFFACTVLFYIYYCRIAGNSANLRLDQLLLMGW
jgi:hypothetical protein